MSALKDLKNFDHRPHDDRASYGWAAVIAALVTVATYGLVGRFDYEDAQRQMLAATDFAIDDCKRRDATAVKDLSNGEILCAHIVPPLSHPLDPSISRMQ